MLQDLENIKKMFVHFLFQAKYLGVTAKMYFFGGLFWTVFSCSLLLMLTFVFLCTRKLVFPMLDMEYCTSLHMNVSTAAMCLKC
jgi:hypothetical protein